MRRREFLGSSLAFMSLAGGVPSLLARAAADSARADANDHALVVIELSGGNDGLNTVVPFEDARYYRNRRTLGVPKGDVIRLTDRVGLHPRMDVLGELFREGKVSIVQGVGYPQPDRSHFRSMEIWHTASIAAAPPDAGWLGRCLDGLPPLAADGFPRGLSLTADLPQALRTEREPVPVDERLDALATSDDPGEALRRNLTTATGPEPGPRAFLRGQAATFYRTAEKLAAAKGAYKSTIEYPDDPLGQQLRRAAQVLTGRLGVRILYAAQGGYDTHADQADTHGGLLESLSRALSAFQRDLAQQNLADSVTVLVFSEFGRRVDENASRGTDHGAASCVFLVGSQVRGGLAGEYPSLEHLGEGDLIFGTDFRSVYATVLQAWLGCPAEKTLGQGFPLLELFRQTS